MKQVLSTLVMAMMAVGVNAQAVIAEVDWTKEHVYFNDNPAYFNYPEVRYSLTNIAFSITNEGLVISSNPRENATFWEAQLPIVAHINELREDRKYQVRLTVNSTVAGELHLELKNEDDGSSFMAVDLKEGLNELTVDFQEFLSASGPDGMLLYQCGYLPGTHVIKKVQVIDLDAEYVDDLIYDYNSSDKTAELKGLSLNHKNEIEIPETVVHNGDNYTVTKIGERAFYGDEDLTSVIIPNTVTTICNQAFEYCTNLSSVVIPNSVTRIYTNVFYGCSSLTSIVLPSNLEIIGACTFCGTGLTSISIPSSVTTIGSHAFSGCDNLVSVNFLNSSTRLDDYTFWNCPSLSTISIVVPDKASYCTNNILCQLKKEELSYSIILLDNDGNEIKDFTIPNDVTYIGYGAFYNCHGLESITIPASMEYIEQEAFAGCHQLKQVNAMPETPPVLFDNSFSNYDITLNVPEVAKDTYMSTDPWSRFKEILSVTNGIQRVDVANISETPTYNLAGQKVNASYKGIVIQNGKKVVIK